MGMDIGLAPPGGKSDLLWYLGVCGGVGKGGNVPSALCVVISTYSSF